MPPNSLAVACASKETHILQFLKSSSVVPNNRDLGALGKNGVNYG